MTSNTSARPCSSPARPNRGDDHSRGARPLVPALPGTSTAQESDDEHPTNARSSHQTGTNWAPGTTWLITQRTWPAWQAVFDLLIDGQPHPTTEVAELMHQAAGLAPRTIENHLRSASRRGWIHNRGGRVTVRDSHAMDAALSAVPDA